jgi:outer membrane protein insertion porin family
MFSIRQVNFFRFLTCPVAIVILIASCTVPRRYPVNRPFIYKSQIEVDQRIPTSERQALKEGLNNQLDDSLRVRTVLALRLTPPFFYYRLSRPPAFDTLYVSRSKTFMNALLNANGYFNPIINDTFRIDTIGNQQRVTVRFEVKPGEALRYDSIGYDLTNPELQRLVTENRATSLIKKNDPYSLTRLSAELDRMLSIFRDNGYYRITKEDLQIEQDTVVAALIDPTLDPFEQIAILDSLRKTREKPTINIVFRQRPPKDSSSLEKYYFGNITVYPDLALLNDSLSGPVDTSIIAGYKFLTNTDKFKLPFIARNIAIRKGNLYRQSDYYKTINTFTNLGAWQQVDIDLKERTDSVKLLDATLRLFPARRQSVNVDFETSRNASDVLTTGSLFGIGLNLGMRNRNAFRESIATASNLRFGVELGTDIVQTLQASFAHNIYIPRFVTPFKIGAEKNLINPRTIINLNTAYTNRRQFFEVRSVNASWGYDWSRKARSWQYIPMNFEFTTVNKTDSLIRLEQKFPTLAQAFNNGLIISQVLTLNTGSVRGTNLNFFRARLEESGAVFGLLKNLERGDLRRFVKLDLEYKYFINYTKSAWAFRAFGGYGYVYGKTGDNPENNLPFFKAYFAGGPYSMRAWQVRRLGLGSSTFLDSTDRFGDVKIEANVEYRFDIATIAGIKLESAFFIDAGNVWAKATDKDSNPVETAEFKASRLYRDLAVGGGTSLRFDFDFFLIRLDWAYKLKNPFYADLSNGWFQKIDLGSGQFQLGIGYPF